MRKLIYKFEDGTQTTSYDVAIAAGVPYKVYLTEVPEPMPKLTEKAKARRKSVKR